MFAVIETGGKQYIVEPDKKIKIEKIISQEGEKVVFDKVLAFSADGGNVQVGTPFLEGVGVEGKVLKQGRAKKVIVFKYHNKTRYRKKRGHRQPFTEIQITKVG